MTVGSLFNADAYVASFDLNLADLQILKYGTQDWEEVLDLQYVGALDGISAGWVPFVEVEDVDGATKRATKLGATVIKPRTRGPAGEYAIVRDPGGAAFALWQKA